MQPVTGIPLPYWLDLIELIHHSSNSAMRMLRLPSPFSLPSVSIGVDTNRVSSFLSALHGDDTAHVSSDYLYGQSLPDHICVGGGRLSCVPVLPFSTFDMVSDPGRISIARANPHLTDLSQRDNIRHLLNIEYRLTNFE